MDYFNRDAYFRLQINEMFKVLLDRIVAEQRESRLMNVSATDLLVQSIQELLYRRTTIEAHNLVGAVQKVYRYRVWQGMMVRILHQYR